MYWKSLVNWRNNYSAHRVPGFKEKTPNLETARKIVFIYADWVVRNIDISDSFSLEQYEENFNVELEFSIGAMLKSQADKASLN